MIFLLITLSLFLLMVVFKFWIGDGENKVTYLMASIFSMVLLFNFLYHKIKYRVLMFLGKMSYSLYISHFASVILLLGIFLQTGTISSGNIENKFLWLIAIPFALVISYLFYLTIEKPTKHVLYKMRKKDE